MKNWDVSVDNLDFLADDEVVEKRPIRGTYKVVIADDDEEIHRVTKVLLSDFTFNDRKLEFIDTYTAKETMAYLKENPDVAILFLDVVMENAHSGLDVVEYVRNTLENYMVRIILRTGQPGEAPEEEVIEKYDINDYRLKTEITVKRLYTIVFNAIRSYRDLLKLQRHQKGLEKIISASAKLFNKSSLEDFLVSILEELSSFHDDQNGVVYVRKDTTCSGFVTMNQINKSRIMAATGNYKQYTGKELEAIPELSYIHKYLNAPYDEQNGLVRKIEKGFLVVSSENGSARNYVFIEGAHDTFNFEMINLFLSNFSIALDNYILNNMVNDTQKEIILALAETVESHFEDTGQHVRRVSTMMYNFALNNHFSFQEAEILKLASTMHDLGKIAIPDAILKKPGQLTNEEFEIIKTHTIHGYRILKGSDLPILSAAADIALYHHERYDGKGYPKGMTANNIPIAARMMSIIDVYDAMTHKRVYKDAISPQDTIEILRNGSGTQFDPYLLEIFINKLPEILKGIE